MSDDLNKETITQKAMKLVELVNGQVQDARLELAQQMYDKGQRPEEYQIADNMRDVIEGKTLHYKCWSIKLSNTSQKPRIKRGDADYAQPTK